MKNETHTRYRLTWESDTQRTRKEAYFALLTIAETWYDEKLAEGKSPQLCKVITTVTFEEMRPQKGQAMTHPLTDEICDDIAPMAQWVGDIGDTVFRHCDLRAAADWQLEQVVKWLRATESTVKLCPSLLADQLEQAMRPQQQENNQ